MEELKYNGYAMPSKTPWVTSKPLKHKAPTQKQREMRKYFRTHDFSVNIDPITKKVTCTVKEKKTDGIHKTY